MSQANVDAVSRVWEEFCAGRFPLDAFSDDLEWHVRADLPDSEVCHGPAQAAAMIADGWAQVVDTKIELEEIAEAGDDVLVRWRGSGSGRGSGVPIDWRETHIYALRDGKIVSVREYRNWDEALKAAGRRR
jgi:ketosteroid isomerase-like protein